MSKLAHILAVMVLAAFAAATSVQTEASTDMSVKMSLMTMDGDAAPDCQDCPGEDAQIEACDQACATTYAALGLLHGLDWPDVAEITAPLPPTEPDGRVGAPDPHPPRTIILS